MALLMYPRLMRQSRQLNHDFPFSFAHVESDREHDPVYTDSIPGLHDDRPLGTECLGRRIVCLPFLALFAALFVKGVFIG